MKLMERMRSIYIRKMGKKLSVSNLLGIKYLSEEDLNLIFETADNFKEVINRKIKKSSKLKRYYNC